MSAVAKYIVKRVFNHEGVDMKIGEELVLDSREADPLYKKGLLTGETFLDPDNVSDAAKIAEVKAKLAKKKEQMIGKAAERTETRTENEAVKDESIVAKREEVKAMIPADAIDREDQQKAVDSMTDAQLDRKKKDLEEKQPDEELDEEIVDGESTVPTKEDPGK